MCLIDSLVKSSGHFARLFSRNIIDTFAFCYDKVDPEEKEKMIRILKTWNASIFPNDIVSRLLDKYVNKRRRSDSPLIKRKRSKEIKKIEREEIDIPNTNNLPSNLNVNQLNNIIPQDQYTNYALQILSQGKLKKNLLNLSLIFFQ